MLHAETSIQDGFIELRMRGELDITTVHQAEQAWNLVVETAEMPIILDLCRLTFLDSSGAKFLLRCALEMDLRNRSWRIVRGDNRWTELVLVRLCWEAALPLYRTLEQALESLQDQPSPHALQTAYASSSTARASGLVLWLADAVTRDFLYVSENVSMLFNGSAQQWLMESEGLFGVVHPDDRERVGAAWYATVKLGMTQGLTCRVPTATSNSVRCQVLMAPVHDASEQVRRVRGSLLSTSGPMTPEQPPRKTAGVVPDGVGDAPPPEELSTLVNLFWQDEPDELTKAEALHELRITTGKPWKQVARMVGLSHTYAKRLAGLLKLEDSVRARLRTGELPVRVAFALMPLPPERQVEVAERAISERLSAEQVRSQFSPIGTSRSRRSDAQKPEPSFKGKRGE